jgi:dihydrofolate reductase
MALRLDMTVSLDGFVSGPDDGPDAPMGEGGFRLFDWLDRRNDPGPSGEVYAETLTTRAVVSGRRTYEHAGRWGGDHHDGVPIVVLTHEVPDEPPPGSVVYATDPAEAAARARAAAGDADVVVMGAGAAQALLAVGELDELSLHVVPVLLGRGRRLFDGLPADHVELELVRRLDTPDTEDLRHRVTHLRYRVVGPSRR